MKTYESDILIIGGGASGLCAAVEAAEMGASVIVLEKMSTTGGCANMSAGPFAVESPLQKRQIMGLTKEQAVQKIKEYTHCRPDERRLRKFVDKSGDTIQWLMDLGIKFMEPMSYFPDADPTWHCMLSKEGKFGWRTGANTMRVLTERAQELGVDIYVDSPVLELLQENGKIIGCLAEDEDGDEFEVHAPATIICTGGFGANDDMIQEECGFEVGKDIFPYQIPGLDGDGMKMAWDVGAGRSNIGMEMIYWSPNTGGYQVEEFPFRQCGLAVNLEGMRFMDEETMKNPVFTANTIKRQKGRCFWSVIDQQTLEYFTQNGPDYFMINTLMMEDGDMVKRVGVWLENYPDIVKRCEGLDELAAATGIPAEKLKETVANYNHYCDTRDEEFHKDQRYMRRVDGPVFYAMKFMLSAYGSLGGIRIDADFHVLDQDFTPIPGLFAAGTDTNDISDPDYVFTMPGSTLGYALNSGRLAGEAAVNYVQDLYDAEE